MRQKILREMLSEIKREKIPDISGLNRVKLRVARKYSLEKMPKNSEIISVASERDKVLFKSILTRKPSKSVSGVTVVAVMAKPKGCVGECIYCPSSLVPGKSVPKSYTGFEPSTMRSMRHNFDAFKVIQDRLGQYIAINKPAQKIELIIQGGTFPATPLAQQKKFIASCYSGILGKRFSSLEKAKKSAEKSKTRLVGLTIETRPDFCREKEINEMLSFGATRVELGVQNADNKIYEIIKRNHSVEDVVVATRLLKDSSLKVLYHIMPGLPGSSPKKDVKNFKMLFDKQYFRPDMLKIYPCLVLPNTELHKMWKRREFVPYSSEKAAKVIAEMKEFVPKYVRIMRIQRDIPSQFISAGVKHSNLRQLVEKEMEKQGAKCSCIRCREAALKEAKKGIHSSIENAVLQRLDYDASNGKEVFLSFEDKKTDSLFGFCRLRIPFAPFRKEITAETGLVRELHVYSPVLDLGKTDAFSFQHRGFGKQLMLEAERIAREDFDCKKMVVISGIGVREYYRKFFNYKSDGPYVSKALE